MATFSSPTNDSSVIKNPSLNAAGRTFDQDTDTFSLNPGTWSDPFAAINNPNNDTSVISNATKN